jgi:AcrR family transcriptional regulator
MLMPVRRARRAAAQPAEVRREAIVDAATRVFAATPFRAARTTAIADAAGIAEGTIFRHFPSKRSLYLAALERSLGVVRDEFAAIAANTPDAIAALRAMASCAQEHATIASDHLRLRQRAVAEAEDAEVRAQLLRGYHDIHALVVSVVRRGQQQGTMRQDASDEATAWLFLAGGLLIETLGLLGVEAEERLALCRALGTIQRRALLVDPP